MSINGPSRAAAIYNTIPGLEKLTPDEQADLRAKLEAQYGADTTYLKQNVVVQPTSLSVPAGQTVATTGSAAAQTGTVTSVASVAGTGTIS